LLEERKKLYGFVVFTGFFIIVFSVVCYFYFNAFGHFIRHPRIVMIGISSFFITRAIWYLFEKLFKISPPF